MEKEIVATLIGGAIGVVGSLLSVAFGLYVQRIFSREQNKLDMKRHQQQLDHERALHKEQVDSEREIYRERFVESVERDIKLRTAELLLHDITLYSGFLKDKNIIGMERTDIMTEIDKMRRRREGIMRELGFNFDSSQQANAGCVEDDPADATGAVFR